PRAAVHGGLLEGEQVDQQRAQLRRHEAFGDPAVAGTPAARAAAVRERHHASGARRQDEVAADPAAPGGQRHGAFGGGALGLWRQDSSFRTHPRATRPPRAQSGYSPPVPPSVPARAASRLLSSPGTPSPPLTRMRAS